MKKAIVLVLALAMVLSLCACGSKPTSDQPSNPSATQAPSSQTGSKPAASSTATAAPDAQLEYITLRLGVVGSSVGDLKIGGYPMELYTACDLIYDFVFRSDPLTKEWTSDTLEDFHYDKDGTEMVMTLKKGIMFSNGEEAKAEDLLYSFLCRADDGNSHWIADMGFNVEESYVVDDYTAVLKLDNKTEQLFNRNTPLINAKWAKETNFEPEKWYFPVGSGPYYVAEHTPDEKIVVRLKDEYWKRPVEDYYVNEYIFTRYGDSATAYMALEVGDIDICSVTTQDYDKIMTDGAAQGLGAAVVRSGCNSYIALPGHTFTPFKDERVRRAIAIGVDWDELGVLTSGSLFIRAHGITPSDSPYYFDVGVYEYDPDKAIELLAEAGYGPGDLKPRFTTSEGSKNFGEGLTYYLSKIGIDLDVTYTDSVTAMKVSASVDGMDINLCANYGGSPSRNPALSIVAVDGTSTPTAWVDDDHLQDLLAKLKNNFEQPVNVRKPISDELQQYIFEHVWLIPYRENAEAIGFNTKVISEATISYAADVSYQWLRTDRLGLRSNWE